MHLDVREEDESLVVHGCSSSSALKDSSASNVDPAEEPGRQEGKWLKRKGKKRTREEYKTGEVEADLGLEREVHES